MVECKINGEMELYDREKFQEELFEFLQENDYVGYFSIDFENKERR